MIDDSAALLQQYIRNRSDPAFAEIVRRYVDLVYASARRQVRDAELANDVTQAVFLVLAQKAASVSTDRPLSAWLLRTTTYCAANARRAREHRQFHERKAAEMARDNCESTGDLSGNDGADWEQLAPLLDEGLNKLGAGERDAVILKYFEKKSLRQVGESLGISEEAATKRVSRAVERLRVFFQKRGAVVSGVGLAALLAAESAKAAPAGLAGTISTSAVATSAAAGAASGAAATTGAASVAKGAIILMATQKAKAAAVAALLLLGIGGVVVIETTRSPHQHSVNVPLPPAVVPSSMTKTRWALTFSDNTSVEVMGISDPDAKPPQWWSVDGSASFVPDVKTLGAADVFPQPGEAKRRIVLRMTGPVMQNHSLNVRLTPSLAMAMASTSNGMQTIFNCVLAVPVNAPTTSLSLGLSRGSWRVDESLNVDSPAPKVTPAAPRLLKVRDQKAQTAVDVAASSDGQPEREERYFIELKNGKELDANRMSGGLNNINTYYFDCPLSSVARVVRSSRPYEWVKLTNVSLLPTGQLTDVKIERLPAPAIP